MSSSNSGASAGNNKRTVNAFQSPTINARERLGQRSRSPIVGDSGSSVVSRRSVSLIQSEQDAEIFEKMSASTEVSYNPHQKKTKTEEEGPAGVGCAAESCTSISMEDFKEGALTIMDSFSPCEDEGHHTLDLKHNDNSFHVLASLLVEFFQSKCHHGNRLTLRYEDRDALERLLPPTAVGPFIEALRLRLETTPAVAASPLQFLTLQCQELCLDRKEEDDNPILATFNLQKHDDPVTLMVLSVLSSNAYYQQSAISDGLLEEVEEEEEVEAESEDVEKEVSEESDEDYLAARSQSLVDQVKAAGEGNVDSDSASFVVDMKASSESSSDGSAIKIASSKDIAEEMTREEAKHNVFDRTEEPRSLVSDDDSMPTDHDENEPDTIGPGEEKDEEDQVGDAEGNCEDGEQEGVAMGVSSDREQEDDEGVESNEVENELVHKEVDTGGDEEIEVQPSAEEIQDEAQPSDEETEDQQRGHEEIGDHKIDDVIEDQPLGKEIKAQPSGDYMEQEPLNEETEQKSSGDSIEEDPLDDNAEPQPSDEENEEQSLEEEPRGKYITEVTQDPDGNYVVDDGELAPLRKDDDPEDEEAFYDADQEADDADIEQNEEGHESKSPVDNETNQDGKRLTSDNVAASDSEVPVEKPASSYVVEESALQAPDKQIFPKASEQAGNKDPSATITTDTPNESSERSKAAAEDLVNRMQAAAGSFFADIQRKVEAFSGLPPDPVAESPVLKPEETPIVEPKETPVVDSDSSQKSTTSRGVVLENTHLGEEQQARLIATPESSENQLDSDSPRMSTTSRGAVQEDPHLDQERQAHHDTAPESPENEKHSGATEAINPFLPVVGKESSNDDSAPELQRQEVPPAALTQPPLPPFHESKYAHMDASDNLVKQQLLTELREAHNMVEQSTTPETMSFWREQIFSLQGRLDALDSVPSTVEQTPHSNKGGGFQQHENNSSHENHAREQYGPQPTNTSNSQDFQVNSINTTQQEHPPLVDLEQPAYDVPMVDVVAPADLPGGYHFEAAIEGQRFLATVPPGGVQQGETFTCYMRELDSVAIDIPVGYWKDGFWDICKLGCCHPVFWHSIFCPLIALSQIQTRINLDFLGRMQFGEQRVTNRFVALSVTGFWAYTNLMLFVACNVKWSHGMELSMADICALFLINVSMLAFVIFVTQSTRSSLREKFMIREERCFDLEDLCCASLALPCTVSQMARHTANYDDYEAVCCSKTGLPDGVRVTEAPPKEPTSDGGYVV